MTGDFLSDEEVAALGLGRVGARVRISRHAVLLFPEHLAVGSDVRIDAFCLLVGTAEGITIGDHVHLSAYSCVLGRRATVIGDFCTISVRCSIFTSSDDFSGASLTESYCARRAAGHTTDAPVTYPRPLGDRGRLGRPPRRVDRAERRRRRLSPWSRRTSRCSRSWPARGCGASGLACAII